MTVITKIAAYPFDRYVMRGALYMTVHVHSVQGVKIVQA